MLGEISQHKRTNILWFYFDEVSRICKFIETKNRIEVTRDWEVEGNGKLFLNGYRLSVWDDEKFWKQTGVIGCTTL